MKKLFTLMGMLVCVLLTQAQEKVLYPYPLQYFTLHIEDKDVLMAYMDVKPSSSNGKTLLLFHGKNFNGYYWKNIIPEFTTKGYRVIVPDQVGWGRSDKPDIHFSFHLLAANNKALLDSLHIDKVTLLVHSMGGMLGARFALSYPAMVEKMIMENPIGLEDYRLFVPYVSIDKMYSTEKKATYESYKKYQQSYYNEWKPEYEQYVAAQAETLGDSTFNNTAWDNALTTDMIFQQPVVYEFNKIKMPVLLIIGQADRTIVGKDRLTEEQKKMYGQYPALGRKTKQAMPNATLIELPGIGHIPHIQSRDAFLKAVFAFL